MIELPNGVDINNLIDDLKKFSWEAADILLTYSDLLRNSKQKFGIIKNQNIYDPVTSADLDVNNLIITRINQKYHDVNWEIMSEENFKVKTNNCNQNADWLWVLDPLDGTKDFIQGTDNFAMHLALNYKQKPFIGLVLIPAKKELWITNGEKLWCETRNGNIQKQNMSERNILQEMTVVTSKNHRNDKLKYLIDKVNFKEVVVMGSIGCKVASIIRGLTDIYIALSLPGKSAPKDWDFAAPEAILKAAGGAITNIHNEDLVYGKESLEHTGIVIASNSRENHEGICAQIKEIIEKDAFSLRFLI